MEFPYVDAAAFAKLDPAAAGQVAVGRAYGVGMNLQAVRQLARARQFLIRLQIAADDAERDLRADLLAQRHLAVFRQPDSHRLQVTGNREQGTGNRGQGTGEQGTGERAEVRRAAETHESALTVSLIQHLVSCFDSLSPVPCNL